MKKRERQLLASLGIDATPAALTRATATLRAVRRGLEGGAKR